MNLLMNFRVKLTIKLLRRLSYFLVVFKYIMMITYLVMLNLLQQEPKKLFKKIKLFFRRQLKQPNLEFMKIETENLNFNNNKPFLNFFKIRMLLDRA